jgi:3-dehydroquinate synthase
MRQVPVALGARSYDVLIEHGLIDRAGELLSPFARNGRLVVVTDANVWKAQGSRLAEGLGELEALPIVLPPGEESKNWGRLAWLVERLLEVGIERQDHVVAFGGGVVGDLAGFAAAIVKRGCNVIQLPTSLLAQVDSSVGGKTGINVAAGKNLVGAFHQPALVLIDPACLATLDPRQMRAGYAEIVKFALIEDAGFFEWLEANGPALLAGAPEAVAHAIATAVAGKARIVGDDERETTGRRALLNLGHTFGHALEAEAGFSGNLLHGEAVAAGTALAFDFSVERGLCRPEDAKRVAVHFSSIGLPANLAAVGAAAKGARLVCHMAADKKKERGVVPFVLARRIGEAFLDREVDLGDVATFLDLHA